MISVAHSPSLSAIIRPNTNELLLERRGVGDGGGGGRKPSIHHFPRQIWLLEYIVYSVIATNIIGIKYGMVQKSCLV